MSDRSSWVKYLPPVLWEKEEPTDPFTLGGMLRIFEKILTGIDDGNDIVHGDHTHPSLRESIEQLHHLYDPWTTPPEMLDWLASWVSFTYPALWDEYMRRKAIGEMVEIYKFRGLKEGIQRLLDLASTGANRPRIGIDDGSRLLLLAPEPGREVRLQTVLSHGPSVRRDPASHGLVANFEGMVRPSCIDIAPDGSLFVGDLGTPAGWTPVTEQRVWRILTDGQYEFAGVQPTPRPVGPPGNEWNLLSPVAIAVDSLSPWNVYVLDQVVLPASPALYQASSTNLSVVTNVATAGTLQATWPVAMAFDTNGHLLILDRGSPAPAGAPAVPTIVDVQLSPLVVTVQPLPAGSVVEPMALLVLPGGDLLIADAGPQTAPVPGNLVRVDRSTATWSASSLLPAAPGPSNPLVQPTAVVQDDQGVIYVLDGGLKAFLPQLDPVLAGDPFLRQTAQPAAVYGVDISAAPPAVTRVSDTRTLVSPMDMVIHDGTLVICDRGEYSDPAVGGPLLRVWRGTHHEFGVVIHFSAALAPTVQERSRISHSIQQLIDAESPAHTAWTMVYGV